MFYLLHDNSELKILDIIWEEIFFLYLLYYFISFFSMDPEFPIRIRVFSRSGLRKKAQSGSGQKDPDPKHWFQGQIQNWDGGWGCVWLYLTSCSRVSGCSHSSSKATRSAAKDICRFWVFFTDLKKIRVNIRLCMQQKLYRYSKIFNKIKDKFVL